MAQSALFSSGFELASFVTSSSLLRKSWDVISCGRAGIVSHKGEGLSWNVYKETDSDLTILALESTLDSSNLQADLVPFSALREEKFPHFDFLCTTINPTFSVNRTAMSLFSANQYMLDQLKSEINTSTPLIVTGHGLGGSVASLFTVSLLDSIWLGNNRPLCITFGSPFIGDKKLQQAISRSPIWNCCFLHVVSVEDPLPRLFVIKHSSSTAASTPQANAYMPFGTFLFCSGVNSTCCDNPISVLELLMAMGPIHVQNQEFQYAEYGDIVKNLNREVICKDLSTLTENVTNRKSNSTLASSISLQLQALELTPHMQLKQQNININTLETKIEKLEEKFILQRRVSSYTSKKLSQMKAYMAQLEWYKKHTKHQDIGYYDSYKSMDSPWIQEVVGFHKRLAIYWEKMVEGAKIKPQKVGAAFRKSWLYAGTSYRRMVEPLAIAQYYREGGKDYLDNRPRHFILLEEWLRNETKKGKTSKVEAILTLKGSYFWECVEKALLSPRQSMGVEEMEDYLSIISNEENDQTISSFWASVDQLLLSSKDLNVVKENEKNLNTFNEEDSSSFRARVDMCLLSRQGSVIVEENEENIKRFVQQVDEALLSRQGSAVVKENEENMKRFVQRVDEALLSRRESSAVKEKEENFNRTRKKNVEAILTSDSCFWAHVEEARISCSELKLIEGKEETSKKLVEFEEYVYGLLKNYEVSPEIFLAQSSYMRWWNEYKAIMGNSYDSTLASFMNDARKREQYASGTHDFL